MSDLVGPQSLGSLRQSDDVFASPDQLAGELATLTLLPRSRWQTLLKLEVIQVGNKRRHSPAPHINLSSNTSLGPPVCSNGTNQKSLQSRWRRHHSFCPCFQALNIDSRCKRKRIRPRKRSPRNALRMQQQRPKAYFCRSFGENLGLALVSTCFLSVRAPCILERPGSLSDNHPFFAFM